MNATCHKCGKQGHISPACGDTKNSNSSGKPMQKSGFHKGQKKSYQTTSTHQVEDSVYDMFSLGQSHMKVASTKLFDKDLGTLVGTKAKILMDPSAQPQFFRARPLAYAYREKLEKELDRLVSEGTIEPVEHSTWATPIVSVIKSDGSVRICGDYKQTVNKLSKVDKYPIPRIDDLYVKLVGGSSFVSKSK